MPTFFGYLLSFLYIGIYWNNHHHLFHAVERIGGGIMWANLGLLFFLSLVPVVTGWVGEHPTAAAPSAAYGVVLFASALAWRILEGQIVRVNGAESDVARRLKRGNKSYLSPVLYTAAIGLAFVHAWIADAMYLLVALLWIVPDRRFEPEPGEPSPTPRRCRVPGEAP